MKINLKNSVKMVKIERESLYWVLESCFKTCSGLPVACIPFGSLPLASWVVVQLQDPQDLHLGQVSFDILALRKSHKITTKNFTFLYKFVNSKTVFLAQ